MLLLYDLPYNKNFQITKAKVPIIKNVNIVKSENQAGN